MTKAYAPEADLPDFYDDLELSFEHAWATIEEGARDRLSPMHTPTLATVAPDGAPDLRTVVLREASLNDAHLRVHTDQRSAKLDHLARDARCAVHGYDPQAKIQVRLSGTAHVHLDDEVADAAWAGSQQMSLMCYAQPVAPGDALADPSEAAVADGTDPATGRAHFGVLIVAVKRLEWLYLSHRGHRRAAWSLRDGTWSGGWLAP